MRHTLLALTLLLAACAPAPLTLGDAPPASTFQTPQARPAARPTAEIRGTVVP